MLTSKHHNAITCEVIETYASRYRIFTPEPPKPRQRSRSLSYKSMIELDVPLVLPLQSIKRSASVDRKRSSIRRSLDVGIALYEFAKHPTQRSRKVAPSDKSASTRPRAASDPTDTNRRTGMGAPRIQKCVTFATAAATKSTAPARPLVKRARTVLQRSFAFADSNEDGEKGFVALQRTFFRNARVRTRNAMDCSATFATTAFHVVVPASKTVNSTCPNVDLSGKAKTAGVAKVVSPTPEEAPVHRSRCSKLRLKRFKSLSNACSLSRFHT